MHDWKPKMQKVTRNFAEQVRVIHSGTVSIGLVQTIRVDCQGRLECRSTGWERSRHRVTAS